MADPFKLDPCYRPEKEYTPKQRRRLIALAVVLGIADVIVVLLLVLAVFR